MTLKVFIMTLPGISVTAPIRRITPWAFIRKNFPFVPTIEMSTLFAFPSKNQLNAQGAVTENPGIMMKNGMYRFVMNNQLFINCYKIWHMYRFIIINNKIFIYNLHLLLLFSYIPIFRGLCPQGVMSAGGFVRRGFYSGGYVRRGFCPQGVMS